MQLNELEKEFSLKFTKGNAIVAFEKLWFLQQNHAQRIIKDGGPPFGKMVGDVLSEAAKCYPSADLFHLYTPDHQVQMVTQLIRADGKNYSTTPAFVARNANFFQPPSKLPPYKPIDEKIPLSALRTAAAALTLVPASEWTTETHSANISAHIGLAPSDPSATDAQRKEALKQWRKELYHYMRWALLGGAPGPGIAETMTILGRDQAVRRIKEAIQITIGTEQESLTGGPQRRAKIEPLRVKDWKGMKL